MSFGSDMATFNMKGAQGQHFLGVAHLSWQPGNVDFAAFSSVKDKTSNLAARSKDDS
jgi:hypothetical protein